MLIALAQIEALQQAAATFFIETKELSPQLLDSYNTLGTPAACRRRLSGLAQRWTSSTSQCSRNPSLSSHSTHGSQRN